jgi:hypothetical protein
VARQEDLGFQLRSAGDRRVDVVDLEPQQDAIAVRFGRGVTNRAVMVFDITPVQMKNHRAVPDEAFVFRTAVGAFTAEEALGTTGYSLRRHERL